ncbi:agmatinase [Aquimarina sp. 2201CG5-10]|uniref:agmatinase n=1 Tax=Aquimarina callyspongiae TaxID=3098150 RepID=UPI002AB54740|nr:agmatinase [Aquimarina sp. 2201CG5-10]MDY8134664.1 agmatinase [Aquimarina sp. 2201CG5-10]
MKTSKTYAGIPEQYASYDKSQVVLVPVPYDGTSTWGKGADKGPEAFLHASENMELYDIETDSEVYTKGIHLSDPIAVNDTPESMVEAVYNITKNHIKRNKFVTLFGGEHSISIGAIRAFDECFNNLTVLQIDAHADLRKEYNGSQYNHACAMYEANENTNLIQVGIRSMDASENLVMNEDQVFFAHEMINNDYWMDNVIDLMTDNVYITFDLDALDPSILPATGTPEPGGLLWYETLELLKKVFSEKNVVGFDIVELCPNATSKASDFLAAKLYYKMVSYKFEDSEKTLDDEDDTIENQTLKKFKSNYEEYDER